MMAQPQGIRSIAVRGDSRELDVMTLGEMMAKSGFFSDTREQAQAVVKILAGQEMGFGPVASMMGINIIKGKVSISGNLMAAAIKRSGRYNFRVLKIEPTVCEIAFFENGEQVGVSTFTSEDAKKAQLTSGDGGMYGKYPRNMLFNRAISNGAKWWCADIFAGHAVYTPDELGARVDDDGDMVAVDAPAPLEIVQGGSGLDKPSDRRAEAIMAPAAPASLSPKDRAAKQEELASYWQQAKSLEIKGIKAVTHGCSDQELLDKIAEVRAAIEDAEAPAF
jgi:hypothetical protein